MAAETPCCIWTIGHSTRSATELIDLLRANGVEVLADVRRFPGSRKYPHFNAAALREAMSTESMGYEHFPELGGRRRPHADSPNAVWRNESFRGYADYMGTPEFQMGIERLLEAARLKHTAVMCSEAVWWRCHRSLIADYLKAMGITVLHILSTRKTEIHPYTAAAQLVSGKLTYHAAVGADKAEGIEEIPNVADHQGRAPKRQARK